MNRLKVYVVSWFTSAEYGFVASYKDKANADRLAVLMKRVADEKDFKVEEIEIEDVSA